MKTLVLLCSLLVLVTPSWSQVSPTLSSSTTFRAHTPKPLQDGTAVLIGRYNPNQMLRLVIGLQPPHVAEEQAFLESLQTKGSHDYHQFLTAEEWTKRFDPSVEDEKAVVDWLTAQGLSVTQRYPNRLIVDAGGPAATIESVGSSVGSRSMVTRYARRFSRLA